MAGEPDTREVELRRMKRRASGLLLAVTVAFLVVVALGDDRGLWGYAQATAEGSMVGGLADWFAVTALFRHPLGLPIPHTAVIRERKDQFGETLGSFVQENFLSADNLLERVRTSRPAERLAAWAVEPRNAASVSRHLAEAMVGLADVVRDDEVSAIAGEEVTRAVERLPIADFAARALEIATADGRHQQVLDALLRGVSGYLDENRHELRRRFADESPWWLPGAAQDRIFERILDGARSWLHAIVDDPAHELRTTFDERIATFAARLRTDPELAASVDRARRELLEHPELRAWLGGLWSDLKASLRAQAGDDDSHLRRRIADAVVTAGRRLAGDDALQARVESALERTVEFVVGNYADEISELISGTIARWDADETSTKLELLLGRDLQFIRINGTVVGALAGLTIHAVAVAFA
ncbi:MAG TPA: DUF445 domain-containing protein [Acidimicrobiales bacterium]|nr:DUF445 domain-containing protein [Acidimicrobiales bacterium]